MTDSLTKVAQKFDNSLGHFEILSFKLKNDTATFEETLGEIGQLFIPPSGHTDLLSCIWRTL